MRSSQTSEGESWDAQSCAGRLKASQQSLLAGSHQDGLTPASQTSGKIIWAGKASCEKSKSCFIQSIQITTVQEQQIQEGKGLTIHASGLADSSLKLVNAG
jgi:hypothetical protein